MKRTIRTILCAAAVILAAISCQKFNLEEGRKGTIDIRIGGLMGEYSQVDGTKAELVNTVRVSWAGGETVYVYDGTQCLGSLKATLEGTEDRYALLSTDETHTVNTPAEGTTKLTLVYSPLLTGAPSVSENAISISLANQSSEKAPFVVYATLDYNNETSIENAVVPFRFATSIIKVNCTGLKANEDISSATLKNVNTACKLSLSGTDAPVIEGDVNGIITRTRDANFAKSKVNAEGEAVFQIAVPKLDAADSRVLTIKQGLSWEYRNYYKDEKFTEKALNPATSVNTVCQLVALPAGAKPGVFSVSNDNGANIKQIYFSWSNLWYGPMAEGATATFNFDLGEVNFVYEPLSYLFYWSKSASESTKETYNSSAPRAVTDILFTNATESTPNNNFTVRVNGAAQSGWRTLSQKEWNYLLYTRPMKYNKVRYTNLIQYTTLFTTLGLVIYPDDYSGDPLPTKVTSIPDDVVFLPFAGCNNSGSYSLKNSSGIYWTSNSYSSSDKAYSVVIAKSIDTQKDNSRDRGCSIRLVKDI